MDSGANGGAESGKMPELRISKSEILLSNVDSFRIVDPVRWKNNGKMN
jgi:hypothetical protein